MLSRLAYNSRTTRQSKVLRCATIMDKNIIIFLLVPLLINVQGQGQLNRCILSREDHIRCQYVNRNLKRASANQYSIHHTRLRQSQSGFIECNVRPREQVIVDITSFGNNSEVKYIYSPGFLIQEMYDDQLRVEYRIQCAADELAYFNVTENDIQGKTCADQAGINRCQDYVEIDRGSFGTSEFCGNDTANATTSQLELGTFNITFRTSEMVRGVGFSMLVVCFKPSERDLEGCLNVSVFNSSVCTAPDMDSGDGIMCMRRRRGIIPDMAFDDEPIPDEEFLHNEQLVKEMLRYPKHMRIRKDLVDFHLQWIRMKRQTMDVRFIERNILFTEGLRFTNEDLIQIIDEDDNDLEVYNGVFILQTFNASGEIETFFSRSKIEPTFLGPGVLFIVGSNAYLVGFVIDPRGLIPTAEEEIELVNLTAPLLNAINTSVDVAPIFENQTLEELPIPLLRGRRKRQTLSNDDKIVMAENVFNALRNLEACNPVLRASARATLDTIKSKNSTFVEDLLTFVIDCTLENGTTICTADSEMPIIPEETVCTTIKSANNQVSENCDPFNCPIEIDDDVVTFRVTAINCNGQRGEATLTVRE